MPTLLLNKTEVGTCIDLDEVFAPWTEHGSLAAALQRQVQYQ